MRERRATFLTKRRPAPGYIVVLDPSKDGLSIPRLQQKYGIAIESVYNTLPGFFAEMSAQTIAGLRCEPNVMFISQNAYGTLTNVRP